MVKTSEQQQASGSPDVKTWESTTLAASVHKMQISRYCGLGQHRNSLAGAHHGKQARHAAAGIGDPVFPVCRVEAVAGGAVIWRIGVGQRKLQRLTLYGGVAEVAHPDERLAAQQGVPFAGNGSRDQYKVERVLPEAVF